MKKLKKMKGARALAAGLAMCMMICGVVGGSMAWLIDTTDSVKNTFTYGDVNISLEESDSNLDNDNNPNTNKYEMIPGSAIDKDPIITVRDDSESCWVFVELEKSANFDDFMTYEVAAGWNQLKDAQDVAVEGVYYRLVESTDTERQFSVLMGDQVMVKDTVTKDMLNALDSFTAMNDYPTLTVTGYAVQLENIDHAITAWGYVQDSLTNP